MAESPEDLLERSQRPPMPDARLQAPAWTIRRALAVKKGLRLYSEARSIPALTTLLPRPAARGVCAPQRSSEARCSLGDTEEEKQWAISPLTLCGVSV